MSTGKGGFAAVLKDKTIDGETVAVKSSKTLSSRSNTEAHTKRVTSDPIRNRTVSSLTSLVASLQPTYDTLSGPNAVATLGAVDEEYHFCCGYPVADAQGVWACPENRSSFTISNSRLMFGSAALENATVTSSTDFPTASTNSGDSLASSNFGCEDNDRKIGLGVGVPLGVLALLAVAWGLWERKRARTQSAAAVPEENIRHDKVQSSHSDYESRNGQDNGYLQPAQQEGWPVVELRTARSPVEMETHGGNEGDESWL
ncbi:hypothetical protein VMCG_10415 [Cytospora schulzeri]|uniref:Mid2 domain-containing protein n=1 Tax=Cytospora schulzeri TaxID=448051 RepID=A0A423VAW5_9PEZI|nr:hypothetical protein VMCG_10415 [Valsa malicola]